jgi:hypothetical protein
MNENLGRIWKEAVVVLSRNLQGGIEKNHENSESGQPVYQLVPNRSPHRYRYANSLELRHRIVCYTMS